MANNYRELYESIDAILDEEDNDDVEVEINVDSGREEEVEYETEEEDNSSLKDLLKEIVGCLSHCAAEIADGEQEHEADLKEKLKKIRDILKEKGDNESSDEEIVEDAFTDDDYGTRGMGPRIGKDGVQDYSNPNGQSYAARKGFTGL